ncbi:hypothetical protein Ctha_0860 [Chloroherpeton thalassium ATCC 35110]|uniref:Uncharacterized protein n=1 Tax=Chloroherpeton thalassium (strain ATCC 35110 / GB-78) TaxID=517418 RepID=B3QWW4_CHLT3|nr:hypothetical protein Ctha_0860 [Chloroherpeton thalassium ATCC 35110]
MRKKDIFHLRALALKAFLHSRESNANLVNLDWQIKTLSFFKMRLNMQQQIFGYVLLLLFSLQLFICHDSGCTKTDCIAIFCMSSEQALCHQSSDACQKSSHVKKQSHCLGLHHLVKKVLCNQIGALSLVFSISQASYISLQCSPIYHLIYPKSPPPKNHRTAFFI